MILHFFRDAEVKAKAENKAAPRWEDLVLWKMDLKGAYNLVSFSPADAHFMASETDDEKVLIFLVGTFGWTGTPGAFQVVTRAIVHELSHKLAGACTMYVDDLVAVSWRLDLAKDQACAVATIEDLLGEGSVEHSKTASSDDDNGRLVVIGYVIDMRQKLVAVAEKNILRAVHGFFTVDETKPVSVHTLQQLASWATRYSMINRRMRPFTRALYREYSGRHQHVSIELSESARRAIRVFRVLLLLTAADERRFTRALSSFDDEELARYVIEFDACLFGIGLLWFRREEDGSESLMGGSAVDITSLGFGEDSSFQNVSEFMAATMGLAGLRLLLANAGSTEPLGNVEMRGDSIAALTWTKTERFRSDLVGNAAAVFTLASIDAETQVSKMTHISAKANERADALSRMRQTTLADTVKNECPSLSALLAPGMWLELDAAPWLALCDPKRDIDGLGEKSFVQFWHELRTLLRPQ
jgi:hypothetical protein